MGSINDLSIYLPLRIFWVDLALGFSNWRSPYALFNDYFKVCWWYFRMFFLTFSWYFLYSKDIVDSDFCICCCWYLVISPSEPYPSSHLETSCSTFLFLKIFKLFSRLSTRDYLTAFCMYSLTYSGSALVRAWSTRLLNLFTLGFSAFKEWLDLIAIGSSICSHFTGEILYFYTWGF